MRDGIASLQNLVQEWLDVGSIAENDWAKMRALDFQEILRSREGLVQKLSTRACTLCTDFPHHVSCEYSGGDTPD